MTKKDQQQAEEQLTSQTAANDPGITDPTGIVDDQALEITELQNQLARALADYQNLQRRLNDERVDIAKYATKDLLLKLIPILEHLDKAIETAPDDEKKSNWFSAVSIAVGQLKDILKKEGVEEINPHGSEFDGSQHEAVDVEIGQTDNQITKVLQKGYKLYGKVISPARVVVGKKQE